MFRIVVALLAIACLCSPLCSPAFARPKVYYETHPDGSMSFFTRGPRVKSRSYFQVQSPQTAQQYSAPAARPAANVCPQCGRPLN